MDIKQITLSRFNKGLLSILLVSLLLYLGKSFLVPVAIAAFFAMLLYPFVLWLQHRGIKEPVAALLSILLLLTVLVLLFTLITYQIKSLQTDLPRLEDKVEQRTKHLQWLVYQATDITENEQEKIIDQKKPDIAKAVFKSLRDAITNTLALLLFIFIILTYTFFFILYQHRIQHFFVWLKLFESRKGSKVMLARISQIIYHYLKGTLIVISIMAVLYAIGFSLIGVDHAILFALIAAVLRIVPYFGSFIGIAFPIAFSVLTGDSLWQPVLVLLYFMVLQLLEANLLTPFITGSRVKLNPLATIMVILFGNLVWGVAGMILFVPLFASLKVIFDRIPVLQPYGYLLGKEKAENED